MSAQAPHPFRVAWERRELEAWTAALAADVVVRSPMLHQPIRGRQQTAELYAVLSEIFGEIDLEHEFAAGDAHAFFWRGQLGGRTIQGADLMRHRADGLISELTVFIRPLADIGVFAAAAGPPLVRDRGRARRVVVRLMTAALASLLAAADAISARLVLRR